MYIKTTATKIVCKYMPNHFPVLLYTHPITTQENVFYCTIIRLSMLAVNESADKFVVTFSIVHTDFLFKTHTTLLTTIYRSRQT